MKFKQRKIVYLYLILYPILPGYFRIMGTRAYKFLSIFCAGAYLISTRRQFKIKSKNFGMILGLAGLWILLNLVHYSTSGIINTILDYVLVLYMLLDYFNSRERVEEGLEVLMNTASVMCFFGLFDFFTKRNLFSFIYSGNATDTTPDLQMRGIFARSEASFGHAIPFAIYLSINALIALYFFNKTGKKKYQYLFLLLSLTLITTISRAPILVYIIGLTIFMALMGMHKLLKSIGKVAIVAAVLLLVTYIALPTVFSGLSFIWNVMAGVFSENALLRAGDFQNSNPFEYRLALFSIARNLVRGKELFGTGNIIEQFVYGNNPYSSNLHYSIDNAYLYWLVRYGIVGLITNLIPLLTCIGISLPRCRKEKIYALFLAIGLILALNWFSVASLAESKIWFILFAMIWSTPREKAAREPIYKKELRHAGNPASAN